MASNLEEPELAVLTPQWQAPASVHACFTLREGGVSSGPFGNEDGICGMNVGLYCGDAKVCVRTNRGFLSAYAGSDPKWCMERQSYTRMKQRLKRRRMAAGR